MSEKLSAVERVKKKLDMKTTSEPLDDKQKKARLMMADSGELLKPDSTWRHSGYAVVHVFEKKNNDREIALISMSPMGTVNEVQAGLALDHLKQKMMAYYGRQAVGKKWQGKI